MRRSEGNDPMQVEEPFADEGLDLLPDLVHSVGQ